MSKTYETPQFQSIEEVMAPYHQAPLPCIPTGFSRGLPKLPGVESNRMHTITIKQAVEKQNQNLANFYQYKAKK